LSGGDRTSALLLCLPTDLCCRRMAASRNAMGLGLASDRTGARWSNVSESEVRDEETEGEREMGMRPVGGFGAMRVEDDILGRGDVCNAVRWPGLGLGDARRVEMRTWQSG